MSVADQLAIRALNEAYADAVFRRDADAWSACWAEDAAWELLGTRVEGRSAIRALWEQAMAGFSFVSFLVQQGPIEMDGDRATSRVFTNELLVGADGAKRLSVGRYDDDYVRTERGWRFAARRFSILQEVQL